MWQEFLQELVGQNVAILCARYTYRGKLDKVGEECLRLTNAYAVEVSGSATSAAAETEDKLPSVAVIALDAIELVFQPTWALKA